MHGGTHAASRIAVAAALVALAASAAPLARADAVSFRLNWYLGGLHVPFYYGKEQGLLRRRGHRPDDQRGPRLGATPCRWSPPAPTRSGSPIRRSVIADGVEGRRHQVGDVAAELDRLLGRLARRDRHQDAEGSRRQAARRDRRAIRSASCSRRSPRTTSSTCARSRMVQVDPAAKVVAVLEKRADGLLGGADDQYFLIKQRGVAAGGAALRRLRRQHRRHDHRHAGPTLIKNESRSRAALRARDGQVVGRGEEESGRGGRRRAEGEAGPQPPVDARAADGRHRPARFAELQGHASAGARRPTGTRRSRCCKQVSRPEDRQALDGVPHERVRLPK